VKLLMPSVNIVSTKCVRCGARISWWLGQEKGPNWAYAECKNKAACQHRRKKKEVQRVGEWHRETYAKQMNMLERSNDSL